MPNRPHYTYGVFMQEIYDVIACYGPRGERGSLPLASAGRKFREGVLEEVSKLTWDAIGYGKREEIIERMEKDQGRAREAYEAWRERSEEYPQASGCLQALIGEVNFAELSANDPAVACGKAYGRLLLAGEVPSLPGWITSGAPPPFASQSRPSRPRPLPSQHERPADLDHAPKPPFLQPAVPEPTVNLRAGPSELLHAFGAAAFLQTDYAKDFLKGVKAVLQGREVSWTHLTTLQGCDGREAPYDRLSLDVVRLEHAWNNTPRAHKSKKAAFKTFIEVLFGNTVTNGVLKEAAEQLKAKILGEGYAAMLVSLTENKAIHLPSLDGIAFHHGKPVSFVFESLGARISRRPSAFVPVARAARW